MPDPDVLMSDLELYDTIWELRRAPEFIEVRTAATGSVWGSLHQAATTSIFVGSQVLKGTAAPICRATDGRASQVPVIAVPKMPSRTPRHATCGRSVLGNLHRTVRPTVLPPPQALEHVIAMEVDHAPAFPGAPGTGSGTGSGTITGLTPAEERLLHATDPLHLPTPMDIDATVEAAMAAAVTAAAAAAAAGVGGPVSIDADMLLAALHRPNLYVVVDTNVLLRPDGVALLNSLRRRYAPRGLLAAAGADGGGGGASKPLHCVAVVPWTVVAELDGLKGGAGGAGGCWVRQDKEEGRLGAGNVDG